VQRIAVQRFFEASIDCALVEGKPRGCLINTVAPEAAGTDAEIRDKLSGMFEQTDAAMARRMAANQSSDETSIYEPQQLARMAHSVTHSVMTRARAGASREDLSEIAIDFMNVFFPQPESSAIRR
jgi:hypothetical protein